MKQIYSPNWAIILSKDETISINHPTTIFTDVDVVVEVANTEEELNYKIAKIAVEKFPPLPKEGEKVEARFYSYDGKIIQCIQDHNRMHFTPEQTPALFNIIEPISEGYPAWKQPTGAHDAYKKGDRVVFNGKNYESLIDANVWSPSIYPQGWKVIN